MLAHSADPSFGQTCLLTNSHFSRSDNSSYFSSSVSGKWTGKGGTSSLWIKAVIKAASSSRRRLLDAMSQARWRRSLATSMWHTLLKCGPMNGSRVAGGRRAFLEGALHPTILLGEVSIEFSSSPRLISTSGQWLMGYVRHPTRSPRHFSRVNTSRPFSSSQGRLSIISAFISAS